MREVRDDVRGVGAKQLGQALVQHLPRQYVHARLWQSEHRADEVEDEVVGNRSAVRDAAALDPRYGRVVVWRDADCGSQLGEQARLADARLAEEDGNATASGTGYVELLDQLVKLFRSADERAGQADCLQSAARSAFGAQAGDAIQM